MNKEISVRFQTIHRKMEVYKSTVAATFSLYREGMERARERCKAYKDESGALRQERETLSASARTALAKADSELAADLIYNAGRLKEELGEYISKRPSVPFIDVLRVYQDFGLSLSRAELDGLLLAADGTYIGLRAVAGLAAASGFRVTVPPVEQYQKEIQEILNWSHTPLCYAPLDYVAEAKEVYPQIPVRRADGSRMYDQTSDSTYFIMHATAFDSLLPSLKEIAERWEAAFVPDISQLEPIEGEDETTVTPQEQRQEAVEASVAQVEVESTAGEDLARKMGKAAAERAQCDLSRFII